MLLGTALKATALRVPKAAALVEGELRWTYAELNADVNRLAHGLKKIGLKLGDRIACSLTNRAEFLILVLATQKIGVVAVPLNYRLTPSEIDIIAADCSPRAWCFEGVTASVLSDASVGTDPNIIRISCDPGSPICDVLFSELLADSDAGEPEEPAISDKSPSLIMYTSGTTGRPKGVVLDHRAQFINSILMIGEFGLVHTDRTLHIAPLYHVAAYHVIALPHILVGAANILVRRYDPETVASVVEKEHITNILGAPTHFELWASRGPLPSSTALGRLRYAFITGAPVRPETVEWIQARLTKGLWNVYGQTEASSLITLLPPEEMTRMGAINCIGRTLVGMETRIVPPDCPIDLHAAEPDMGELIARGPKLMTEYYGAPDKTATKLQNGWLRTGDLVQRDADGYYYLLGRVDDLIITGGENVYPIEIEQIIAEHEDVADCAVVGIQDPVWGQIIAAFIVPKETGCDMQSLTNHLDARVANHKRPRRWALIEAIPRNPSGKVILRELRAQAAVLREMKELL
jgi:acyl-CoA synthetase (AMP-forming)/AMP-acid ligase II